LIAVLRTLRPVRQPPPDLAELDPGNDLAARSGRDGAHAEWFYGFRLAIRTDLAARFTAGMGQAGIGTARTPSTGC
jgi:hypothetical protein